MAGYSGTPLATKLGKPYQWAATGPNSFDCSGLTSWAFKQAGVTLPRSSSQQATVGKSVKWADMQPGDLVFYYSPVSHVGIYAGDGKMINAPQTGDVVKYQTVSSSALPMSACSRSPSRQCCCWSLRPIVGHSSRICSSRLTCSSGS